MSPLSNQESQITAITAPVNNATKAAVVNQDSYAENIFNSAASDNVTPSTYNSFKTNAIANQNSSIQATNSDPTIAGTVATG